MLINSFGNVFSTQIVIRKVSLSLDQALKVLNSDSSLNYNYDGIILESALKHSVVNQL
jgi:hypothetical protein